MATLDTLLDVETETETVWQAYLAGAPYNLRAWDTDNAVAVTTPRVECVSTVVKWGPHQITPTAGASSGQALYDQFVVQTSLTIVYQPEHAQGQSAIRGAMRRALSNWAGIKAGFAVRNYLIPAPDTLRQIAGGRTIDDAEKTESITSVLEFVVFLNPNALNAAT